ncbi:1918_t:CDS:2, partial [Funneliformis caledonium]
VANDSLSFNNSSSEEDFSSTDQNSLSLPEESTCYSYSLSGMIILSLSDKISSSRSCKELTEFDKESSSNEILSLSSYEELAKLADLEEEVRETGGKRADIIHLTEEDIESKDNSSKSDRRSHVRFVKRSLKCLK